MSDGASLARSSDDLRRHARESWAQDRPAAALDAAWAALDLAHDDGASRRLLTSLLQDYPASLRTERRRDYLKLLTDRKVEPDLISTAGWQLVLRRIAEGVTDADVADLVRALSQDELALTLLRECPVYYAPAERLLTRLRRRLLRSGEWRSQNEFVAALRIQASLNGGAWPFDDAERAQLEQADNTGMVAAYTPARRRGAEVTDTWDPVTRAVAAQYEGWPYPAWTRITVGEPRRLPDVIRPMDAAIADALPVEASILVAGCGTGRQAAYVASRYPDATVTAIDVSESSLAYARRQCRELGIRNLRFLKLDLHDVAQLGERFHSVHCGGVLHHLPNPEAGFKVLADVLHSGGIMQIMVYNRLQRLVIAAARTLIADLVGQHITDDLLRQVRRRILENDGNPTAAHVAHIRDFATLAGVHDLLLHRHEDPFDLTRIEHVLDGTGLQLLSFDIASPAIAARYDAMFPNDPRHRDVNSWARFVRTDATAIVGHFRFFCCKSPAKPA